MSTRKQISTSFNIYAVLIFLLILAVNCLCTGCKNTSSTPKEIQPSDNINTDNDMSHGVMRIADFDEKTKEIMETQKWILNITGEPFLTSPLVLFFEKNQRYPYDVAEFLDSGLLIAWPANPSNGEPFRLVDKVELKKEDIGKIAYVRESDSEAYFEIVDFDKTTNENFIRRIPYEGFERKALDDFDRYINKDKLDLLIEEDFRANMESIISAAFMRPEYRSGEKTPSGFAEAANGNFFLIKENIKPSFISGDASQPLFLEVGLALLDGRAVEFYEYTFRFLSHPSGKEYNRHITSIEPIEDSLEWWTDQDEFDRLTNKEYYYSTRMILNDSLETPEDVLISKSEILNP